MRLPLKLCADRVPSQLHRLLPCKVSPAELTGSHGGLAPGSPEFRAWFSARVSSLTLKGTWRSTRPGRHVQTNQLLARRLSGTRPVIIDVGVSDGVTSLEFIEELGANFAKYYVTDRFLTIDYVASESAVLFFDKGGVCVCAAGRWLVFYPQQPRHARFLQWRHPRVFGVAGVNRAVLRELSLLQPQLRELAETDSRIAIAEHDAFVRWPWAAADVVKIANLLNRAYFTDPQILAIVGNAHRALQDGARLVVVENRGVGQVEQTSVFLRRGGGFVLEEQIGTGSEIASLVLSYHG